ncbi:MFS general substrate transporter [Venturia nashicola]|uniref:MFS general substrate transporter n=1 Tax=Venturia nashicola TaxID=86259 RepID=A0A4Z1NMJ6_9PEZI|nr:MFS general substrate transporter [Venturia nashicola]TLD21779.1 MFS general substrate transporter [Venturia nashicola]
MCETIRESDEASPENDYRTGSSPTSSCTYTLPNHPYHRNDSSHQIHPAFRNKPRQESKINGPISKLRKLSSSNTDEKSSSDSHIDKESDDKEVVEFEEGDEKNPFNWPKWKKWVITITVCFISILTGLPAGAYGAGNAGMERQFHVSQSSFPTLYWATASWNLGAALFPLFFVPLTESMGRMTGYFVSYILFLAWLFGQAFAQNFATMVVVRFFGGGASSIVINCAGGTITDIWKTAGERSFPMSLYGMTSVVGIALGPFIGGAIQRNLDWRWIYYIQIALNGGFLPIFWLLLKETRGDVLLRKRAKKMREEEGRNAWAQSELSGETLKKRVKTSVTRPMKMLVTEPVVISFTLWVSFAWGILYNFSTFQTSLIQLALSAGAIIGLILNPIQDHLYLHSASRNKESKNTPIPESRLYFAIPGSLIFTAGLFWYGWTSSPTLPWILPTLGIGAVGLGIYEIYMAVINYLSDSYVEYAASALSAASLGRNLFGAFLPLASQSLFGQLGYQWAGSLLGFIGLVLSLAPVVLVGWGRRARKRSSFVGEAGEGDESDSGEQNHV